MGEESRKEIDHITTKGMTMIYFYIKIKIKNKKQKGGLKTNKDLQSKQKLILQRKIKRNAKTKFDFLKKNRVK